GGSVRDAAGVAPAPESVAPGAREVQATITRAAVPHIAMILLRILVPPSSYAASPIGIVRRPSAGIPELTDVFVVERAHAIAVRRRAGRFDIVDTLVRRECRSRLSRHATRRAAGEQHYDSCTRKRSKCVGHADTPVEKIQPLPQHAPISDLRKSC